VAPKGDPESLPMPELWRFDRYTQCQLHKRPKTNADWEFIKREINIALDKGEPFVIIPAKEKK